MKKGIDFEKLEMELQNEILGMFLNGRDSMNVYEIVQGMREEIQKEYGKKGLVALDRGYTGAVYEINVRRIGQAEADSILD